MAGKVKAGLQVLEIDCFLAHEDVVVSEEWKSRILEELRSADIFICLLSDSFKKSDWCSQELGFAASRKKLAIIPLSIDQTVSFGFINNIRSRPITRENQLDELLINALLQTKFAFGLAVSIKQMERTNDHRHAEAVTGLVMPFFRRLTCDQATRFAQAAIKNPAVWNASECVRKILPCFLDIWESQLPERTAKALRLQITERTAFKD